MRWKNHCSSLLLQTLKRRVDEHQAKLIQAKAAYRTALNNLETISDEIHARRRLSAIGPRGRGVGAEDDGAHSDDISNFKMESDGLSLSESSEWFLLIRFLIRFHKCVACCNRETEGLCLFSAAVISVNMEDNTSEDDPETQSTWSLTSTSAPVDLRCSFSSSSAPHLHSSSSPPSLSPDELPRPGSGSLEGLEQVSPVLGPRSECSGASSPDCEQERGERYWRLNDKNKLQPRFWKPL